MDGTGDAQGLTTNAQEVQNAQLRAQKTLRRLENQTFNPNAINHTNPSIPDASKAVMNLASRKVIPGDLTKLSNQNLVKHTNPAIKDPGTVVYDNSDGLKSKLGSKLDSKI